MAMSLDGFVTHPDGQYIYPVEDIRRTEQFNELVAEAGAVVMDKFAYEMADGDFTRYEYQLPIFVLTENVPAEVAAGENGKLRFIFITEKIETGIAKAKEAAGKKNVMIIGWTTLAQDALRAKLVDEIIIRLVPVLVGQGIRLFENFGKEYINLTIIDSDTFASRTDLRFSVRK